MFFINAKEQIGNVSNLLFANPYPAYVLLDFTNYFWHLYLKIMAEPLIINRQNTAHHKSDIGISNIITRIFLDSFKRMVTVFVYYGF